MLNTDQLHGSRVCKIYGTVEIRATHSEHRLENPDARAVLNSNVFPLTTPGSPATAVALQARAVSYQSKVLAFGAAFAFVALHSGHGPLFAFGWRVGGGDFALLYG